MRSLSVPRSSQILSPRVLRSRLRSGLLATGAALLLGGCASQQIESYAAEQPALDLKTYFDGRLVAHGMFQDRSGQVVRRFLVEMTGTWQGNQGVLDERFTYSDGKTERRVWRLIDDGNGHYRGTADDVVGEASGQVRGNAFNWRYTLRLPVDGKVYEVQFDDWMYRIDERIVLNRAEMRKFGIRLGEVTLAFTRLTP
ncbi:MAG: DUF3833 domain-containing protein [Tepidimonas fonticaldi]|nr:DUF3833 domain-containing protein [Tepidimonas fonticaldi]